MVIYYIDTNKTVIFLMGVGHITLNSNQLKQSNGRKMKYCLMEEIILRTGKTVYCQLARDSFNNIRIEKQINYYY